MSELNFKPTSMWESTRQKEISAFEEGVRQGMMHWQGNHSHMVKENKKLRERIKSLEKQIKEGTRPVVVRKLDYFRCSSRSFNE